MKKLRILVVEDERVIAMDIKDMLESLGYEVPAVTSFGDKAVEQAGALQPDLVLMDIQLQGELDGIQASARIREQYDIPTVYLTGNSDDPTFQRAKRTEPFGFVLKPFEEKDLQTAIEIAIYKHGTEKKLRQQKSWLAATLRGIGDAVIATDNQKLVTFMNPVAEKLTGWTQEEARLTDVENVYRIVDEHTKRAAQNPIDEVLAHETIVNQSNSTIITSRNGDQVFIEQSAAPIKDDRGQVAGTVLVFRDVTERRRAQQQLLEREEQLRQAQKMEAVGQLAGGIAHDFNNTLTVILGYADLLLRKIPDAEPAKCQLEAIRAGAEHAASLTRQLLAYSRKQILQPRILDLNVLVEESLVLLQRLLKEDTQILLSLEPNPWPTKVDPGQLQQVITNLAINAGDAMPNGGKLIIETKNVILDQDYANSHATVERGNHVMLAVSDTGHGIPKAIQSRIFEPFFTTKPPGKGTGIGLATVYGIVKQSGGNIWVYSEPDVGTTFKIYLPAVLEKVPHVQARPRPALGGAETILIAEDEEAVRKLAKSLLEASGYKVIAAADGVAACKACEESGTAIDLLLTDVIMPNMNGQEVAQRAAKGNPKLRVLFMSGYTDDAIVHHGVLDQEISFIQKPFETDELLLRVRQALDKKA